MDSVIKEAIERYQCPGCACGSEVGDCFKNEYASGCSAHVVGTTLSGVGRIALGMPKGFNRIGGDETKIYLFAEPAWDYSSDKLNIPVWKYFDGTNTLIRGLSPRISSPFLHVVLGDVREAVNCEEITDAELAEMD